jgi:hypothetical protein
MHDAMALAWAQDIGQGCEYESQRLHGMVGSLHQAGVDSLGASLPVCI